jgi:hypothetical protein
MLLVAKIHIIVAIVLLAIGGPVSAWRGYGGAGGTIVNNGGLLLNSSSISSGSGFSPALNWLKTSKSLAVINSSLNGRIEGQTVWDCPIACSSPKQYLSATTGDLVPNLPTDVIYYNVAFFNQFAVNPYQYELTPFTNFRGQVWNVTWDGCNDATIGSTSGVLGTGAVVALGANGGTITFGSTDADNVGLVFTFTGRAACYANPPHNIKVFQSQYAANVARGEFWNPDWINEIRQFGIFRLMDWSGVIGGGQIDISQFADANWTSFLTAFPAGTSGCSTVSSGVMTISSATTNCAAGGLQAGQVVTCVSCPVGTTIVSQLTAEVAGRFGDYGTYQLSNNFTRGTQAAVWASVGVGKNRDYGPKGGVHPALACSLANTAGVNIEFQIPMAAPDAMITDIANAFQACMNPGLKVKYTYGNENWNTASPNAIYTSAQPGTPASGWNYTGYRSAQIFELIYNAYGSGNRSRWIGSIGTQFGNVAVTYAVLAGAMTWVTGGATHTLQQLVDWIDVAPYTGPFIGGDTGSNALYIQDVTAAATPHVQANGHAFVNGQVVKMYVTHGTMSSVLNNVYVTVSNVSTNFFDITCVTGSCDTTGLTFTGNSVQDMVWEANYPKLMDRSTALNLSTPATYPNKFSYFHQQVSKMILSGSASDASYGTITMGTQPFQGLQGGAGSIQDILAQQALIANSYGLKLSEYEGGITFAPTGVLGALASAQFLDYWVNWQFVAGVTGDSTNTIGGVYAAAFQALRDVNGVYSAQYNDAGPQGPWGSLRYIPGDEANPKWQAMVAENARGVYVDPTPMGPGVGVYNAANKFFANGACNPCTDSFPVIVGTSPTTLIVAYTNQGGAAGLWTLTCDGMVMTLDAATYNRTAQVYSGYLDPPSGGTISCSMAYTGAVVHFTNRTYYPMTATGLLSHSVQPGAVAGEINTHTFSETKGALIVGVATCGISTWDSSTGVGLGGTATIGTDNDPTGTASFIMLKPNFTTSLFTAAVGCNSSTAVASYR